MNTATKQIETEPALDNKSLELKTKNQFEVLKRIDTYIGTTNTKCTIIMSYCAAAIALTFTLLDKLDIKEASVAFTVSIGLASTISLISAAACMILACLVIFPVTYSKKNAYHGTSLLFFGDIAKHANGEEGFKQRFLKTSDIKYLEDLTTQVHSLSTIASTKFQKIQLITIILIFHFLIISLFLALCLFNFLG
ncbi:DUF5706 domain-containing protein [Pseudomonas sp. 32.2.56]|uniref:Pycsar system effector family protein n=1 Tax=Pseudomonas sp. 32.2.56 TaxID=2969303 RepID=UPI00214F9BBA|nr:Pycsar system effector family protein [Pseudomonas sp. 32.2.56]MCR4510575.1 DUF5706 domain-containing protein [Pseudomonas sp. 32.2.56]